MHYLRITIAGRIAKRLDDRIESALRGAGLAACSRPDPAGITFEVMGSDEDVDQLLQKLWSLEEMGSEDLHMSCKPIRIDPSVDPGSGPRTMRAGLVTCERCRALREPAPQREIPFQSTLSALP